MTKLPTFLEWMEAKVVNSVERIENGTGVITSLGIMAAVRMILQEAGEQWSAYAAQNFLNQGQAITTPKAKYVPLVA